MGFGAICFEGNIDFYGKSGFTYASDFGIRYHGLSEGEDASFFLCKELIPGYLTGITGEYATPQVYFVDEAGEPAPWRGFRNTLTDNENCYKVCSVHNQTAWEDYQRENGGFFDPEGDGWGDNDGWTDEGTNNGNNNNNGGNTGGFWG